MFSSFTTSGIETVVTELNNMFDILIHLNIILLQFSKVRPSNFTLTLIRIFEKFREIRTGCCAHIY